MRVGEIAERAGVNVETLRFHITNGESAGDTLRQTTLGGAVLPWQDVLHEGPVPALPRQGLLRTRARFLADCGWGRRQALLSSLERRDRQLLEALRNGLQVVLWFEHDLYDQLQLLDVLALAHIERAAPELIVVGSFPGRPSFAGLGELTANELETLWPSRGRATLGRTRGGDADRVELLDIDRWIGGTHITPDNTWRWDTSGLELVRPV